MKTIKKLLIVCFKLLLILGLLFVIYATATSDTIVESAPVFFDSIYQNALGIFKTLAEQDIKNNITQTLNWILDRLWVLIPLVILLMTLIFSSSKGEHEDQYEYEFKDGYKYYDEYEYDYKGEEGERIVSLEAACMLDNDKYHLLNNVTLRTGNGTTQIDHIIISIYGIFVIETKNMSGWIFGNPKHKTWTQVIYEDRYKFQNPLHQNYKHVKALKSLLRLNSLQLHSVVVFVGGCDFMTEMPENVTYLEGFIEYVESKQQPVLVGSEVKAIIEKIEIERLEPSLETHREHVRNLRNRYM